MSYKVWGFLLGFVCFLFLFLSMVNLYSESKSLVEVVLMNFNGPDLVLYLLIDWVSILFIFLILFISVMVIFYTSIYMMGDKKGSHFIYLVLLFVGSMIIMVMSPNMFMILLGWDGLGLVSYCLVIYYQNEGSNSAGMLTVLVNRIGDVGMLLSLLFMMTFGSWSVIEYTLSMEMLYFMGGLMMLGAVTKSAQMPFSAWLPAAMAAPTPVSALVHSSTLVTAGVYLIIRLSVFYNSGVLSMVLMWMSIMTMFMSGLGASFEMDVKKIIALSTLSQLGLMMMILSIGFYDLAFFHLMTHAMFKAMLFLCAGVIIHGVGGGQDIRSMGLIFKLSPLVSGMMGLSSLSLLGFPFLSGFYSKDMVLEVMYMVNNSYFMLLFIILATLLTTFYSMRMMYYIMWKGVMGGPMQGYYENKGMLNPISYMGVMVVFLGCMLSWLIFPHPIFLFLVYEVKLINLILVLLGGFMFMLFMRFWNSGKLWEMAHFLGQMWFLSLISGVFHFSFLNSSKFYFLGSDQGWIEESGVLGVKHIGLKMTNSVLFYQLGSLKMILLMFFFMFFYYIV